MKRTFTKYPSSYVSAATAEEKVANKNGTVDVYELFNQLHSCQSIANQLKNKYRNDLTRYDALDEVEANLSRCYSILHTLI